MEKDTFFGLIREFIIIFTDLDGTLLDHHSYKWDKAKPALDLCKELHIPVIMVSSKTRSELVVLGGELRLSSPFISENGGGIFFPAEGTDRIPSGTVLAKNWWKWSLGTPYNELVTALREIREELGYPIRGFSDMSEKEITHRTGLDPKKVPLAALREFDEPFIIPEHGNPDMDAVRRAAIERGFYITKGGRFYHIHGKNDKGAAVKKLIEWYEESYPEVYSVGLGDSPNDFSMLKEVDQPVLISSGQRFPGLEKEIPGLMITQRPGPEGWNSAILDILSEKIDGGFF